MAAQSLSEFPKLTPARPEGDGGAAPDLALPVAIMRDRRHIEVRQAYALPRAGEELDYTLEMYVFLPRAMGVSVATYPKSDFYTDAGVYIRLDAPGRTLAELGNLLDPRSPLAQVHATLPLILQPHAPPTQPLVSLCQLHAHELSEAVMSAFKALARTAQEGTFTTPEHYEAQVAVLLADGEQCLVALRQVRAEAAAFGALCHPGLPLALAFAEEYASAVMDEQVALLSESVRESPHLRDGRGAAVRILLRLARFAMEESKLRLEAGYALPWDEQREYFTYRLGLLKKELQQALYLNTRELKADNYLRNSAAMMAAGLAATWAFVAQMPWQLSQVGQGAQYALMASAVGAYMLKDRIKEWTRDYLMRRLTLDDYSRAVVAGDLARFGLKGLTGRARERVRFLGLPQIDDEIRSTRLLHRSVMGTGLELEEILAYRRRLTLKTKEHASMPPGFGIREIFRLNISPLTRRLDDPLDEVAFYDAPAGAFRRDHLPKVYHANLILRVTAAHTAHKWLTRYRMVLNQDGLVRMEPVVTRFV